MVCNCYVYLYGPIFPRSFFPREIDYNDFSCLVSSIDGLEHTIRELNRFLVLSILISLPAGGLIYTFRDKRPQDKQKQ